MARPVLIVAATVLGCASTVVVAWWCTLRSDLVGGPVAFDSCGPARTFQTEPTMVGFREDGFGLTVVNVSSDPLSSGPNWRRPNAEDVAPAWALDHICAPLSPADQNSWHNYGVAAGWPAPAMVAIGRGSWDRSGSSFKKLPTTLVCPTWLDFAQRPLEHRDILPNRPLYLGFIANATLYTAAWWLLLFLPGHLRRRFRRSANHCPHCNYDLAGLPPNTPCPECGRPSQ